MTSMHNQIQFSDDDVVNLDDWIPDGEDNPHNVRPWLLHDHGFPIAVVFAGCLQDALDIAVDENRLEGFRVDDETLRTDYDELDRERLAYLGNNGEPYDIEGLSYVELPNPPASVLNSMRG